MTRGLETILPLPSASSADSSRFRKRLAAEPNSDSAKVAAAGAAQGAGVGRQVHELRVGEVDRPGALAGLDADGVVVAADVGAGRGGRAAQVGVAQLDAQRAAEAVVGLDDARLDQHLAHRDVDLGDDRRDLLELGRDVGDEDLVGAHVEVDRAARRQDAVGEAARAADCPARQRLVGGDLLHDVFGLGVVELERLRAQRFELGHLLLRLQVAPVPWRRVRPWARSTARCRSCARPGPCSA